MATAIKREFLTVESKAPDAKYHFRHEIVQEAIYNTLLRHQRHALHARAAQVIEGATDLPSEEKVERLAYHYLRSGQQDSAITYLVAAAEGASRRYANETAVAHYQEALSLLEAADSGFDPTYFKAKIGLGQSLKLTGRFDEARQFLTDALQEFLRWSIIADATTLLPLLVNGLRELADVHQREGNYQEGITHLEAAIEALSEHSREEYLSLWLSLIERLAFIHMRQGKLDSAYALAHMGTTEIGFRSLQNPVNVANLFNTLGGIAWQQGNIDEAIFHVKNSLEQYEHLGYFWGIANAYSNLGVLYAQQGEWSQAINDLEQAWQIRQDIGDIQSQALSLANLGQLRVLQGDHPVARQNLQDALKIFQQLNDNWGIAQSHATLAQLAYHENKLEQAQEHVDRALELAESIGSRDIQANVRSVLALLQAMAGDIPAGIETANSGAELARTLGLTDFEADNLRILGKLQAKQDQSIEAEIRLRESLELARQINDPHRQGLALLEMGQFYYQTAQTSANDQRNLLDRASQMTAEAQELFTRLGAQREERLATELTTSIDLGREPLSDSSAVAVSPSDATSTPGEHRRATMVWLQLIPEDTDDDELLFATMQKLLPALTIIVREYGGQVRRQTDGLEAVFGVPVATETAMEDGVRAAVHAQQYLHQAQAEAQLPLTVQFRAIVAHGRVIASTTALVDQTSLVLLGESLKQAQQRLDLVPVDAIWVTAPVQLRTRRLFDYETINRPVGDLTLWQLTGAKAQPEPARGLPNRQTRFVGRQTALTQMLDLAENLRHDYGGLIMIEGEAGIGKSRLMREFCEAIPIPNQLVWQGSCSSQRTKNAFHLFSDLLIKTLAIQPTDAQEQIYHKLEQTLANWPYDLRTAKPYLEMLVGLPPSGIEGEQLAKLEPDQLRNKPSSSFVVC